MKPRNIPLAARPPCPPPCSENPVPERKVSSTSSSNLVAKAANTSASHSSIAIGANNTSHMRKVSETSKCMLNNSGLLHTELRAQKRLEFEQSIREKERLAAQQRLVYEQEKQRQEQELIQRLRNKSTFKSQPIRHYRPVEVKPSEKPLTSPKSPHIGSHQHASLMKRVMRLGNSHEDLST